MKIAIDSLTCRLLLGLVISSCAVCLSEAQEFTEAELAEARRHWSFQPIANPKPPAVKQTSWIRNDIDRFVLRKLEAEKVAPSVEADRVTLLRRLYLDLIGLPPTPEEVESFVKDRSPTAYEAVVERLLKSPHYGERWGRFWLDMARYADSNGYESDRPRPYAWRWRDWVIGAINRDMPFDQFTIEQIAGDLLPNASVEQLVATGFHRNTLVNTEGGVDREEDRVKRTVDRTNTLGKVWLGLTLECCQCHSHKYDAISQHEYFSLYAFFNSLDEPDVSAPTAAQRKKYGEHLAKWRELERKLLKQIAEYRSDAFSRWEQSLPQRKNPSWEILNPMRIEASAPGTQLTLQDDLSIFASGPNNQADNYTITVRTTLKRITAIRVEALADERLPAKGPGLASNGNFVLSSLRVFAKPASNTDLKRGKRFRIASARADFSQNGRPVTSVPGDDPTDGWAVYPNVGKTHTAIFELHVPIELRQTEKQPNEVLLTIELDHQVHHDHNLGRFRISATNAPRRVPDKLSNTALTDVRRKPAAERTGTDVLRLVRFFDYHEKGLDRLVSAINEHRRQQPRYPTSLAQVVREIEPTRTTHVHERGSFLEPGDIVHRKTPSVLPSLTARAKKPDRMDLANWLVSESNPLTARVIVNRVWQQHFGRGLVVSDDDFGTQGELPSHPELLDWLASRFKADGWSLKKLHRLIVTSATWRQSSSARKELHVRDPYNTWLAKQNRIRVEAEIVRDLALSTSGLLSRKIGGPSVRPPQPADVVKLGFQTNIAWPVSEGSDRYRRGLYTFFQRTVPYPMLIEFDAADSNSSCTKRERSNTPLQALTLWNDPVFVECAQALGRRIVLAVPNTESQETVVSKRINLAFQLCMSRQPTKRERRILTSLYSSLVSRYSQNVAAARRLAGSNHATNAAEIAASVGLARTLINLDEFITRE